MTIQNQYINNINIRHTNIKHNQGAPQSQGVPQHHRRGGRGPPGDLRPDAAGRSYYGDLNMISPTTISDSPCISKDLLNFTHLTRYMFKHVKGFSENLVGEHMKIPIRGVLRVRVIRGSDLAGVNWKMLDVPALSNKLLYKRTRSTINANNKDNDYIHTYIHRYIPTYIHIYIYIYLSLSLSIYIYIYVYMLLRARGREVRLGPVLQAPARHHVAEHDHGRRVTLYHYNQIIA